MINALVRTGLCSSYVAILILLSAGGVCGAEKLAPARPQFGPLFSFVGDFSLGDQTDRTDYESFDPTSHLLYIAKMGEGTVLVFDTVSNRLVEQLRGYPKVTGVLAVPGLHRIYASVPGAGVLSSLGVALGMIGIGSGFGEIAVLDSTKFKEVTRVSGGVFPDGIAFDPATQRIFVSDEFGAAVNAIDAKANRILARIKLDGDAGNVQYDAETARIYVAVQSRDSLVVIDPAKLVVLGSAQIEGCRHPHGLVIASVGNVGNVGYVACDGNSVLVTVDLSTMKILSSSPVAYDPDVLVIDQAMRRLYVASESGVLSTFSLTNPRAPAALGDTFVGEGAHAIALDPGTHRLYFALAHLNGRSELRVMAPTSE